MTDFFEPLHMGELRLPNRIVMAPLTRCRAVGVERAPNALMQTYYRQRSAAGLIISEATSVAPMGVGYPDTPGIWSEAQVAGWAGVTRAVHAAGGRIVLQLWHVGRISHPTYLDGQTPIAPSAIAAAGHVSLLRPKQDYPVPRALETHEVAEIIAQFGRGAEYARRAGFDGVELHAANGYLLDQFLQDSTNHRTDAYGGSIANRARLLLACTDAAIAAFGKRRVGVHLAPRCDAHDMGDSRPEQIFGHVIEALDARGIAFVCARENVDAATRLGPTLKKRFRGAFIANEGLTVATARELLAAGDADAVAFGRPFISNPDLVSRIARDAPLAQGDASTFYGSGAGGYTDYTLMDGSPA